MNEETKERLIEVLSIQSVSYNQELMFDYIISKVKDYQYYIDEGNIYVTKGIADIYPCVVSHMDTVHDIVEDLIVLEFNGNLTGFNRVQMEQTGIGGDDKVGIFIALECLERFDNIKLAFFRDEEVGCIGSYVCDTDFFTDCSFILQCDRRGNSDFVTNASGVQLSGKDFQDDIKEILDSYGYKFANGMMTDVMAIKENGVKCAMANMSCGYYNPHTAQEFVNTDDVMYCLYMVEQIIYSLGDKQYLCEYVPKPKYVAPKYTSPKYTNYAVKSIHQPKLDNWSDRGWDSYYDWDYKKEEKYLDCEDCGKPCEKEELTYLHEYNAAVCKSCHDSFENAKYNELW